MRILLLSLYLLCSGAEKDPKMEILKDWISTQNDGSTSAINQFIDQHFSPELKENMKNREDHVAFYRQIIDEFGEVQDLIFKEMEVTDTKLKVQLLKKGYPLAPEPSPEEILVVEIDVLKDNPKYLSRGLGMGALICYIKR
ncbi:hypothetical protein [Roseivirga sp.]|uniref:hypothetical protein n=1 Tax=Roseivirga sp. TaxID=1964215 RepID=UPI003B52A916